MRPVVPIGALVLALLTTSPAGAAGPSAEPPLEPFLQAAPRCAAEVEHCFEITLHVVVKGDGTPVVTPEWLAHQLSESNRHFTSIDVNFQVTEVRRLPATDEVVKDRRHRDLLGRARYSRGPLHVFMIGNLYNVDAPGEIRGVHWRDRAARSHHWVVLASIADDWVLAHEIGHFFGLPHSRYPISIMNKKERDEPDPAIRTFAKPEQARMRRRLRRYLRTRELVPVARPQADAPVSRSE